MTRLAILLNLKSAAGQHGAKLEHILKQHQGEVKVFLLDKESPAKQLVQQAYDEGCTTIVAAGGDGTISCIVSAIMDLELQQHVKLGVLPMGTFNHFAKDLDISLNLEKAFEVVLKGKAKHVDVAKVNDTYFINNSSLGVYPKFVKEREILQEKGWSKKFAFPGTLLSVIKNYPLITIDFTINGKRVSKKTPFVFIGNNKYQVAGLTIGKREYLDQGTLCVCIADNVGRFRMLWLGLKALRGNIIMEKDFHVIGLQECRINSYKRKLLVSYDGEVAKMRKPLHYKILPKALTVIVP